MELILTNKPAGRKLRRAAAAAGRRGTNPGLCLLKS